MLVRYPHHNSRLKAENFLGPALSLLHATWYKHVYFLEPSCSTMLPRTLCRGGLIFCLASKMHTRWSISEEDSR